MAVDIPDVRIALDAKPRPDTTLVIGCGALAPELIAIRNRLGLENHMELVCLPAALHNTPQAITDAVEDRIKAAVDLYGRILIAYGDCGTGGALDRMLERYPGVDRIAGAHCYAFFSGRDVFDRLMEAEPGSFFLTDYLARHFETLVWRDMRLDNQAVRSAMFGGYTRLVYLAQTQDETLTSLSRDAAERLGLAFERRFTGFGDLDRFVSDKAVDAPA